MRWKLLHQLISDILSREDGVSICELCRRINQKHLYECLHCRYYLNPRRREQRYIREVNCRFKLYQVEEGG